MALAIAVSGIATASVTSAASPAPGNNGTLKIHEYGTPVGTEDNQPKVCAFNVEGFGFDPAQQVALAFSVEGGDEPTGTLPDPNWFGPYTADSVGYFASEYFNHGGVTLAAGHYKATAYGKDTGGTWVELDKAKSKVFKVTCGTVQTGTVTVTKQLKYSSEPAGETTFPVVVTCPAAGYQHTFSLGVDDSATTEPLPAGTTCTVSETPPAGWDPPTYVPSATVTIKTDQTVTVKVVNNRPYTPPQEVAGLTLTKTNQPTGAVKPGDVIAYGLTVTATGNVTQDGVVVSDVMPTYSTYVTGSAVCVPADHLPCDVALDTATRTLKVGLGSMDPGDILGVKFSVRVDTNVPASAVITNVGTVRSDRAEATSNPVTNTMVEVLGEKITKPTAVAGEELAATGSGVPLGAYVALGLGLTLAGLSLLALSRRWEEDGS